MQLEFIAWGRLFLGFVLAVQLLVPSEVWHTFVDHEDSHHCIAKVNGAAVGVKHIHCMALELNLPMADQQDGFWFEPLAFILCSAGVLPVSDIHFRYESSCFLRGPPALLV